MIVTLQDAPTPAPAPPEVVVSTPTPPAFDPNFVLPQVIEVVGIVLVALVVGIAAVKILRPLVEAWAARLSGRGSAQLRDEMEQLREQVGEVEHLRARVAELEERVDFTERLLSRQEAPRELPR